MKVITFLLLVYCICFTGAWQYVDIPNTRPTNCNCQNNLFCKVVFINPKTIKLAQGSNDRVRLEEGNLSLDVIYDDSELASGISGTLVDKDGLPYTVETCPKNTDNERQFHRLIRQHLTMVSEDPLTEEENNECCGSEQKCEKVNINTDLYNQDTPEGLYLDKNVGPAAGYYRFRKWKRVGRQTLENIYSNNKDIKITLITNDHVRSAVVTDIKNNKLFSLEICMDKFFWKSSMQPGARSHSGNLREHDRDLDGPPDYYDLDLLENSDRAEQGPDTCWFGNVYYCSFGEDSHIGDEIELDKNNSTDLIGQNWCNTKCLNTTGCFYFTWKRIRGIAICNLMTDCRPESRDICLRNFPQTCMSGPKNCSAIGPNRNCSTLQDWGPGYVDWQCETFLGDDVDAYKIESVPWGTTCVQSCDSWRAKGSSVTFPIEGHLVSTCMNTGTWSDTTAYDGQGTLKFPPGEIGVSRTNPNSLYPVPSDLEDRSLICECAPLEMIWPTQFDPSYDDSALWYKPNGEFMTDFLCDYELEETKPTVSHNNTCQLFCDNYLTASVRCWDGKWTGRPELGFWCQKLILSSVTRSFGIQERSGPNVDGNWSSWNLYSSCNQACSQTRQRECNNPAKQNDGAPCIGHNIEKRSCTGGACIQDGGWSSWTVCTDCKTKTGTLVRYCDNPPPLNGGKPCKGGRYYKTP